MSHIQKINLAHFHALKYLLDNHQISMINEDCAGAKYEIFLKNELLARYRINKLYIIRLGELIISSKINNSDDEQLNKN